MTKRIIGICLLVLGGLIILWFSYTFYQVQFEPDKLKGEAMEQFEQKGISDEQKRIILSTFDKSFETLKIVDLVLILGGIGFVVGGFLLFKKGSQDKNFSNTFKFD